MLAIRLQRTGRKGHAQYRMIVQDSRLSPTSGKVVASLGNYNPHSKDLSIDKEKTSFYLSNGAQPSPRVVRLLTDGGVKMPDWVKTAPKKERTIKNLEKLRRNRPAETVEEAPATEETASEEPAEEPAAEPAPAAEETSSTEAPEAAETSDEA